MAFFRNPEIKKTLLLFSVLAAGSAAAAALLISPLAAVAAAALCVIYASIHFTITYLRYKKIAALSLQIDGLLHGSSELRIDACSEGELSVLQCEIGKMTVRLRQQAEALQNDKIFLADSIADISHQIRTPLTSVNIIVSMLGEEQLSVRRRIELTRDLKQLLFRIDWLITTLLKLSRLDAGTVQFQNSKLSVRTLAEKAAEPLAVPMELKNQKFLCRIDESVSFRGDLAWTAEALGNIIKNCMEHTPEDGSGRIEIDAEENAVFTRITVKDNGSGIAPEDLPHVFERFYKGRNSSDSRFGVGLALARMIVRSQNGTLKAENNQNGVGASFTMKFYKGDI